MTAHIRTTINDNDEILMAFAEAGAEASVTEWAALYPDYARDLVRFAATRGMEAMGQPAPEAVTRVREIGRDVLRSCRGAQAAAPAPLADLLAEATARGVGKTTLAARLDLPYALLIKLHRRLIAFPSVPRALIAALADELGRTGEEIAAYLRQPPTLALGASYRADTMPTAGEAVDFTQALLSDPDVTDTHKARWTHSADAE